MITNKTKNILLFILLIILMFLVVGVGSVNYSLSELVQALLSNESSVVKKILLDIRLPRVILAALVGGGLSVGGCLVQSVLKNPLATPYNLGVSSGASLAVGIWIVLELGVSVFFGFDLAVVGFIGGILTMLLVVMIARRMSTSISSISLVLVGMILSLFLSSILTLISSINPVKMQTIAMWQLGSFSLRGWNYVWIMIVIVIISMIWIVPLLKQLDLLTFGDDIASSMGVNIESSKKKILGVAALLAGGGVAVSGVIGFIDMVAPYIARKLVGNVHKHLIVCSFLVGAILVVIADTLARTVIAPIELSVGAITAFIGAPLFVFLYLRRNFHV